MNPATIKRACLLGGLATTITSALLVIAGVMIPGFSVAFELYNVEFEYNFSFFLYTGLIFAGLAIAALYYRSVKMYSRLRKTGTKPSQGVITSRPWTKMLAGALLFAYGIVSLAVFGISFTDRNIVGLWLYLGGPSLFLPTGLLPMIIGIVLLLYSACSIKDIEIKRNENTLTISETRPFNIVESTIPLKDIQMARLSNAKTGPRLLWIFIFGFQAYLLLIDGMTFVTNPFRFGTSLLIGSMYILSAAVQIAALVILIFGENRVLTVITSDHVYDLNFATTGKKQASLATLSYFLGNVIDTGATNDAIELMPGRDLKRVIAGAALIAGAIMSRIFYLYTNDVVRFMLLAIGGMLVVEGIKNDCTQRDAGRVHVARGAGTKACHVISNRGANQDEYLFKNQEIPMEPSIQARKLSLPDHVMGLGLSLLAGFDLGTVMLLSAGAGAFASGYIIVHVAINAFLVFFAMAFMIDPRAMMEIKIGVRRFQVLASTREQESRKWFPTWCLAWKALKVASTIHLVKIAIAFTLGFVAVVVLLFA